MKLNEDGYENHSRNLTIERRKVDNMKNMVYEEAAKIDDLCNRWVEDSKHATSAYVFSKLPKMVNNFSSFSPTDVLIRDMRTIIDDVIFAVTDTPRCALCKMTFKNFTNSKSNFKMKIRNLSGT